MKACPYCAEQIQDQAVICRFCQRPYPTAAAQSADARARTRRLLIVAVIAGGLGCVAILGALLLYAFVLAPMFGLPGIFAL